MKKISYLKLYEKWLEEGMPGYSGICLALKREGLSNDAVHELFPKYQTDDFWWVSMPGEFNKTRQNMMLLLACNNGDL